MQERKTIIVDFDGVIAQYEGWNDGKIGDPVPNVKEALSMLKSMGFRIIIQSCRTNMCWGVANSCKANIEMYKWLQKHEIPYDDLQPHGGKAVGDLYIDDRGLRFEGDWQKTLAQIEEIMDV